MSQYEIYLEESLARLKDFVKEMNSRPILFVGSGFSRRYINAPSWSELLEILIKNNPEIKKPLLYFIQEHTGDYAKIASDLVEYYRDYAWDNSENTDLFPPFLFNSPTKSIYLKYKITEIIQQFMTSFNIETNEKRDELELLSRLNPQAFITTNYDNLLEVLFPKYTPIVGQQIIYQKKSTDIGHILKIHGTVEEPNSIVIEKQDYDNFFNDQIYLIAKLLTYFIEHPIVFIGYSLSDENVKSILLNVKKILNAESEAFIPNMWFISWNKDIDPTSSPQLDKSISVGNGESVRVNYIEVSSYEKIYEALYQDSVDIELLKQFEETVYNVVKSDTITNLEVDIASLRGLADRTQFIREFIHSAQPIEKPVGRTLITLAHITDPNQLATQWPMTPTDLSQRLRPIERGYRRQQAWYYGFSLIQQVKRQTGIDMKATNNDYHVSMNGVPRYSLKMVELLTDVMNNNPYTISINGKEYSYPKAEN
ncbi:SIR2 family protein [Paenibacillus agricola]|uniref:SIR2-like domain-containing protein n=1 Tax=Paenibacillus agricola TaxID=2716264 RepID=A0ABX0JHD2_9BACL|nr:SIR2 family protein [Paenibacillus agricola]NHN34699.1 hypothetical protein [Paenibacillus agricola]